MPTYDATGGIERNTLRTIDIDCISTRELVVQHSITSGKEKKSLLLHGAKGVFQRNISFSKLVLRGMWRIKKKISYANLVHNAGFC